MASFCKTVALFLCSILILHKSEGWIINFRPIFATTTTQATTTVATSSPSPPLQVSAGFINPQVYNQTGLYVLPNQSYYGNPLGPSFIYNPSGLGGGYGNPYYGTSALGGYGNSASFGTFQGGIAKPPNYPPTAYGNGGKYPVGGLAVPPGSQIPIFGQSALSIFGGLSKNVPLVGGLASPTG